MNENIPNKEALKEILNQTKESVSAFTLKIENQADLEKLAENDIEDLKEYLEDFKDKISDMEDRISKLPESSNEDKEIQDLLYIKQQLSIVAYQAESHIKEFFTVKPENEAPKVEKAIEDKESIDIYSPGSILDPELVDKIAQLEAINQDTFEFDQSRYDKYIFDEKEGRHEERSVTRNQEKIKKMIESGKKIESALTNKDVEVIYGHGGYNRYSVSSNGKIKLESGKVETNTTGSQEYFEAIRSKAKELGMDI